MIYTTFSCPCRIVANHGETLARSRTRGRAETFPVTLITVELLNDDGDQSNPPVKKNERYYLAERLKATDGWREIAAAVKAAPKLELDPKELSIARRSAEV